RLRFVNTARTTRHEREPMRLSLLQVFGGAGGSRHEEIRVSRQSAKVARTDADDRPHVVIDVERAPDDRWIRVVSAQPERGGDDRLARRTGVGVDRAIEVASTRRG